MLVLTPHPLQRPTYGEDRTRPHGRISGRLTLQAGRQTWTRDEVQEEGTPEEQDEDEAKHGEKVGDVDL